MEAGLIATLVVVSLAIGVIIGMTLRRTDTRTSETHGFLYVDCDAPEGQGLFLEQLEPTAVIASKKKVVFRVLTINQNSRK